MTTGLTMISVRNRIKFTRNPDREPA
jgi:hypothetical protein